MSLFKAGKLMLSSGAESRFKIECDALTDDDWAALAERIASRFAFGEVEGVPTGGLKLAEALKPYTREGARRLLVVDDVLTTGRSMERQRGDRPARGVVVFARGKVPSWVTPIFEADERWFKW